MKISKNFLKDLKKVYNNLVNQFVVVKSLTRKYGYSIKAPNGISWVTGPKNTFGWYRLKSDAQKQAAILNKGK